MLYKNNVLCIIFLSFIFFRIEWDTIEYVRTLNNFPLINDIS